MQTLKLSDVGFWQSFDVGVTAFEFKYGKVKQLTFKIIKEHEQLLQINGFANIKMFETYSLGEINSNIYVNVKFIKDIKQ